MMGNFVRVDVTPCLSSTGCWNPDHSEGTGFETKQDQLLHDASCDPETATGIGAAPTGKLRADAHFHSRALAQISAIHSSCLRMKDLGHIRGLI